MVWFRVERVGVKERVVIRNAKTIPEVIGKGKCILFHTMGIIYDRCDLTEELFHVHLVYWM